MLASAVTALKGKFKWCLSGTPFQVRPYMKNANTATESSGFFFRTISLNYIPSLRFWGSTWILDENTKKTT